MKSVKCDSGLMGWQCNLQENYCCYYEFENYTLMFNLHTKLGYRDPSDCWDDNPVIQGSVNPSDYKKV